MSAEMLDLFSQLPAGSQPISTSEDAADSLSADYLGRIRRQVLAFIVSTGETGATADEIAVAFNCGHNTTSPRVTELAAMRCIERCDGKTAPLVKRKTRTGRGAYVFRATAYGKTLVSEDAR